MIRWIYSRRTTRSNRRTLAREPRGRFGGVLGRLRRPAKPRQTLLADSKISLRSIFNAASARSAQYIYRRHFSANPFGFAAQRGVLQYYGAVIIENWHYH